MNQNSSPMGIPLDSIRSDFALASSGDLVELASHHSRNAFCGFLLEIVQTIEGFTPFQPVAQLDRAADYESGGKSSNLSERFELVC
jgi:hypothetical protein